MEVGSCVYEGRTNVYKGSCLDEYKRKSSHDVLKPEMLPAIVFARNVTRFDAVTSRADA